MCRWKQLGERATPTARRTDRELEVRFQPGPGVPEELAALAAAEAQCRAFVAWAISLDGGQPVPRVTASEDRPEDIPTEHPLAHLAEPAVTAGAHRVRNNWVRLIVGIVMVGVFGYEVQWLAPHIAQAGHALGHPIWGWLALACWSEMSSMVFFARLQRGMLRAGGVTVRLNRAVALTFAANAMSVSLPAGSVISSGYTFRRMRSWGASAPLVTFGLVTSAAMSTLALGLIAILGATFAGEHPNSVILIVELAGATVLALLLRRLSHRPDLMLRVGQISLGWANRLRRRSLETGQERVRELLEELVLIKPRRRDWLRGFAFAALNWILDLVCLIASCRAVGLHGPSLGLALIAYAAGMAASSVPLLPGGLGVVDGALILALTRGGLAVGPSTAGVLLYRLISFALVALIGWGTWLLIHRADARTRGPAESPPTTDALQ